VDRAPDGARVIDRTNPKHALPIRSADKTSAFSFASSTPNSKTEFSIKVQDALAGATPCILGLGLASDRNKRKQNEDRKMFHWSAHVGEVHRRAGRVFGVHSMTSSARCRDSPAIAPKGLIR
jgi:hypothetical protein